MSELRKRVYRLFRHTVLVAVFGMVFATPAQAHKLNIFAFAESGKVLVDSYFVDGTKARDSKVNVFDSNGKSVTEGMTDKQGHFEFPIPGQFDLKITVDAGMGHRAEWLVPAADLGVAPAAITEKPQTPSGAKKVSTADASPVTVSTGVDAAELHRVVNKAVSEAVMPLVRSIEELKQHDSLTQVIGSIGYIFGVFGLWVFFKSRRENPSSTKEKPVNDR
ncbi:MAG: hypothetical protein HY272_09610 [Gammaproteobacteria bacterium]|nr:hypothetical protein [Gammaproteobacteria bacterium]